MSKTFHTHIGGLRGVAILLVILFHLCPAFFPNCYYGVDVFLVITGYLLFLGLDRNDGSWRSTGIFALKKVQRILPAVSVAVILRAGINVLQLIQNGNLTCGLLLGIVLNGKLCPRIANRCYGNE